jgi:ribonuclease HI
MAKLQDVLAIQEYLCAVNEHATEALYQSRTGNSMPSPNLKNPRKLPSEALFNVEMPPLKRIKVSGLTPSGGPRKAIHALDSADGSFPSKIEISPALATFPEKRTYAFGTCIVVSIDGSAYPWLGSKVAGWGFTVSLPGKAFLADFSGPVVISPLNPYFAGAKAPTNNTGELTGLLMALSWLDAAWREAVIPLAPVRFEYDSDYAANMARRIWRPRDNVALILAVRRLLDRVPTQVPISWAHVYSHTGDELNERADLLAKVGAKGEIRASDDENFRLLRKGQLGNPWDDPSSGGCFSVE